VLVNNVVFFFLCETLYTVLVMLVVRLGVIKFCIFFLLFYNVWISFVHFEGSRNEYCDE
jgi:hypothetical protein